MGFRGVVKLISQDETSDKMSFEVVISLTTSFQKGSYSFSSGNRSLHKQAVKKK